MAKQALAWINANVLDLEEGDQVLFAAMVTARRAFESSAQKYAEPGHKVVFSYRSINADTFGMAQAKDDTVKVTQTLAQWKARAEANGQRT